MKIKDAYNSWSHTASIRLLKCSIADTSLNECTQLHPGIHIVRCQKENICALKQGIGTILS